MTSSPQIPPFVVDRYQQIMRVFDDDREVWEHGLLMRMAAQVAATTPGNAVIIAAMIRQRAHELLDALDWFLELEPPRRFAIAALLVQHRIAVGDFALRIRQTQDLMEGSGIACQPFTQALVTLLAALAPDLGGWTRQGVVRTVAIREGLRRGQRPDDDETDLAVAAVLARERGTVEEIVARHVATCDGLRDGSRLSGPSLEGAAMLVQVGHAVVADGVGRFQELRGTLELRDGKSAASDYPIIALLSLIPEPAERVIGEYLSLRERLFLADSALIHTQSVCIVAADLTLLSLCLAGSAAAALPATAASALRAAMRAFYVATLAQLGQGESAGDLAVRSAIVQGWPLSARTFDDPALASRQAQKEDQEGSGPPPLAESILDAPTISTTASRSDGSYQQRHQALLSEGRLFDQRSRRADLVRWYPDLDQVCERLGWGWGQSLGEWSQDPAAVLLAMARTSPPALPEPAQDWSSASVSELVIALIEAYHRPLRRELERLGILIQRLDEAHPNQATQDLRQGFVRYSREEMLHFHFEEDVVFPLCIRLEDALRGSRPFDTSHSTSSIRQMSQWHRANERDISNLSDLAAEAFMASEIPDPDIDLVRIGFAAMSARLTEHRLMEEDILLPAAIAAEEHLSARSASRRLKRV